MRNLVPLLLIFAASCDSERKEGPMWKSSGGAEKKIVISRGKAYSPKDYLVSGYVSMLDFYADWCGPCQVMAPQIDKLLKEHDRLVLRQVDIVNWESDASAQAHKEFGLDAIPYLRVYDGDGRFVGSVRGADIGGVESLVKKALGAQ